MKRAKIAQNPHIITKDFNNFFDKIILCGLARVKKTVVEKLQSS